MIHDKDLDDELDEIGYMEGGQGGIVVADVLKTLLKRIRALEEDKNDSRRW